MTRLPRFAIFVLSVTSLVTVTGPASAASACVFDDVTNTASVTVADGSATVAVSSGDITVDAIACGTATVLTTDEIQITTTAAGDDVTIDQSGGAFGPGATNEGDGTSEIEIDIAGDPFSLIVVGRPTADRIALGADGSDAVVNLNDAEPGWDADVTFARADLLDATIAMGEGSDWYTADLNADGSYDPITDVPVVVTGGGSPDRAQGHANLRFDGGTAADMLAMDWLGAGCSVSVLNGAVSGTGSTIAGCADDANGSFEVTHAENLFGTAGDDMLVGATWAESFNGLAGDDTIVPGTGNDVNLGGPGTDRLIAESTNGRRFTFDLTAKTLVGQGTDSFKGFEMLISTSVGADTFVGDPARSLLLVSGGGGVNLLDLSSASGGVQVRTVPASDPGLVEVGWIVADGVLVIGTPFADIINGMPGAFSNEHDQFRGMGGDDRLAGAGGADDLLGGAGDDRLLGGVGTDTCVGGPGDDVLKGCEN